MNNKNNRKFFLKNKTGASLIEVTVALGIFSVAIISAMGIFQSVVESQQSTIAAYNVQESMRFALEVMSKEIRGAVGDSAGSNCPAPGPNPNKVFNTNGANDELYFENSAGECVAYSLGNNDDLEIDRDNTTLSITPNEITVSNLQFSIVDDQANTMPPKEQPQVTISMEAEAAFGKPIHRNRILIQTTVSSRHYE